MRRRVDGGLIERSGFVGRASLARRSVRCPIHTFTEATLDGLNQLKFDGLKVCFTSQGISTGDGLFRGYTS